MQQITGRQKKFFGILIWAILFFTLVLCPCQSRALESTLVIDLNRNIRNGLAELGEVHKTYEETAKQRNEEKKQVVDQMSRTADQERIDYLAKQYYNIRTKEVLESGRTIKLMTSTVQRVISDMEKLQATVHRGFGKTSGVPLNGKQAASSLMGGLASLFETLKNVDPDNPKLASISRILNYQDAKFRHMFGKGKGFSLQEQIDYLTDVHGGLVAALGLLESERLDLYGGIFYVVQNGIIRYTENISFEVPDQIMKERQGGHGMDDQVNGYVAGGSRADSPSKTMSYMEVQHIGNY